MGHEAVADNQEKVENQKLRKLTARRQVSSSLILTQTQDSGLSTRLLKPHLTTCLPTLKLASWRPKHHRSQGEKKPAVMRVRVMYSKLEESRFLGAKVATLFSRAVRRARLPIAYSQGFHPLLV
jgi:hypothetical protein